MTNINTIEDLIRVLDENPEWLEVLRSRLLTREVLELPQKFAQLAERVDRLTERIDQISEQLAQFVETTNQRFNQADERFDRLTERVDQLTERVDQLTERVDQLTEQLAQLTERVDQLTEQLAQFIEATNQRFDQIDARFDATDRAIQRLRDDVGILKAAHARNAAIEQASALADDMGLTRVKNLSYDDLRDLSISPAFSDIPINELRSFRRADLVMEATDPSGATCYIAVEISYTANGRDTERAVRNAAFLTRFTGNPAHAAIAGINRDDRIQPRIDSGDVFWHQLELDELESE